MVEITIYVEGIQSQDPTILTIDNSPVFRENLHKLFSQLLSPEEFNLKVQPFGTVTQTENMLKEIEKKGLHAAVLIDLDGVKEKRKERLNGYELRDTEKIFFMIQEMEAWILSQVDKIEAFGKDEGLERKKVNKTISSNFLLKGKHPEEIEKPSEKLKTILRQYFDEERTRRGKTRKTGKRYSKAKDAPKLIGLLELQKLAQDFDEVERLVGYIKEKGKIA